MKKKILILGGGISKERKISLETARQVKNSLKNNYNVLQTDLDKSLEKKLNYSNPILYLMHFMEDSVKMGMLKLFSSTIMSNIHILAFYHQH